MLNCATPEGEQVVSGFHTFSPVCTYVDPENADLESASIHAVAAAVGGFFRELPEPLLTWEMYLEFIRAMGECGRG